MRHNVAEFVLVSVCNVLVILIGLILLKHTSWKLFTKFIVGFFFISFVILSCIMFAGYTYRAMIPRFHLTDVSFLNDLHYITSRIGNLLTDHGVEHCLSHGSALGHGRHESVIPWDDDVDLFVKADQKEKVQEILEQTEDLNWQFMSFGFQIRVNGRQGTLDIFILYPLNDRLVFKGHPLKVHSYLFKNEWVITDGEFGGYTVKVLADPDPYLRRCYGSHWQTIANAKPRHIDGLESGCCWDLYKWQLSKNQYYR
jgi:hypothetical protein